ncbi:MAG: VOC family protein [Gammaproteobacteria bacterium]
MFDLQRAFHTGIAVADLDREMQRMGAALQLGWAPVRRFDPLPFWTPEDGRHEVSVSATYSRQGPLHLELVQGTGRFYAPGGQAQARHLGVWVDDLAWEAGQLVAAGWAVRAAGDAPEAGYGAICYIASPDGSLLLELVSTILEPVIRAWIAAEA